jgi:hypothetical protein
MFRRKYIFAAAVLVIAGLAGVSWPWWRPRPDDPPATVPGTEVQTELTLPKAVQTYLWELEHHHNLLQAYGFRALCDAISGADGAAVEKHLASGFVGRVLQQPEEVGVETKTLSLRRQKQATQPPRQVDRAGFVQWLLDQRKPFGKTPKAKFDVMNVTPPSQEQFDGTWRIYCVLRIWGDSATGGPAETTARALLEVERPTKQRLARPAWLLSATVEQVSAVRSAQRLFVDVTEKSGIRTDILHDNWKEEKKIINTGGLYACDFNRDGYVDLFVVDLRTSTTKLYRGMPEGKFLDVTTEVGLPHSPDPTGRAAIIDYDNDGWEDILCPHQRIVYRNVQGSYFEDGTRTTNVLQLIDGNLLTGLIPCDYNNDGLIDIYATRSQRQTGSWLESRTPGGGQCQLLRNKGNGQFEDVTKQTGAGGEGLSVFTAAWLDYNQDGWPDVYLINEFGNGVLLENQGGRKFVEREIGAGPTDFGSMGLSAGDINNDGLIDIYSSDMYSKAGSRVIGNLPPGYYPDGVMAQIRRLVAGSQLHLNRGNGRFESVGKEFQVNGVGWSWGSSLADLDNDGWLDLYVTAGFMSRDRSKPDG